jgi:hypothetical protein
MTKFKFRVVGVGDFLFVGSALLLTRALSATLAGLGIHLDQ